MVHPAADGRLWRYSGPDDPTMTAPRIPPARLEAISRDADEIWRRHRDRRDGAFHGFVPSDVFAAHEALAELRDAGAGSFVELGAGAGTITIVASWMGFEALGVEIEPWLVEAAESLADRHDSSARFVAGSFLPSGFRIDDLVDPDFHVTYDDADCAFEATGDELDEFDVIYAFPWPGEEALFDALVDEYARPGASFVTYHADEGARVRTV